MRGEPANRNPNRYCHFHQDIRHDTKSCHNLKDEIEELIHCGYLKQFIKYKDKDRRPIVHHRDALESSRWNNREQPPRDPPAQEKSINGVINMITSGSIVAGCSTATGKNVVQELEHEDENLSKRPRVEEVIYFTEDNARRIQYSNDDALVVKMVINDFEVKQILVYSSNSSDILFLEAFEKMELDQKDLQLADMPQVGFNGDVVKPLGRIKLSVVARAEPNTIQFKHTFLVVATLSPYNIILGQPILHALHTVVTTYYLSMKFLMRYGVGVVRGDQLEL
ncbi:PREDICTED: uncharacterized protein LOC104594430 [Nelumbo nucifera]|uniref:Uncharacterized protein LOC104594430 n=1 Tax=Nelumbo nucifera TaxID=4432 RepID=A0A1U7ZGW9_NELNU|nr:PREDICTED: uncharacterized protein LOC104594430 [Nelumbo nucifera]